MHCIVLHVFLHHMNTCVFRKSFAIVMIMIINLLTSHDDLGLCGDKSCLSKSQEASREVVDMTLQTLRQVSEQLIDQTDVTDC